MEFYKATHTSTFDPDIIFKWFQQFFLLYPDLDARLSDSPTVSFSHQRIFDDRFLHSTVATTKHTSKYLFAGLYLKGKSVSEGIF